MLYLAHASGLSNRRAAGGTSSVLEASKGLLRAILRALPAHIDGMRAKGAINQRAVTVRLWNFDTATTCHVEVALGAGADAAAALATLETKLATLRPGGVTNYDSWAQQLREAVAAQPSALHSALLVTDGGATQRERFVQSIEAIGAMPSVGFFQVIDLI